MYTPVYTCTCHAVCVHDVHVHVCVHDVHVHLCVHDVHVHLCVHAVHACSDGVG